ncbi:MAG: DUF928 domain-containing protein [Geminicoccales bacterium]
MTHHFLKSLILSIILCPWSLIGHAGSTTEESNKPETKKTATTSPGVLEKIVFVPHDFGAPDVTEAAGVRGAPQVAIQLLAPEQLSRTLSETPTFYWYVSQPIDQHRFTLIDEQAIDPLLEVILDPVEKAGIYSLSLANHDIALEAPGLYRWSIAASLNEDPIAAETVAQTVIAYDGLVEEAPINLPPAELSGYFAGNGYWYDLLDLISRQPEEADGVCWHELRDDVLEQVGLTLPSE